MRPPEQHKGILRTSREEPMHVGVEVVDYEHSVSLSVVGFDQILTHIYAKYKIIAVAYPGNRGCGTLISGSLSRLGRTSIPLYGKG